MSIRPLSWNAGDAMISGMIFSRNRSAVYRPPRLFAPPEPLSPLQVASCAPEQLFGVIQENSGVVASLARSWARPDSAGWPPLAGSPFSGTTLAQSAGLSVIEWNHGNGLCLGTY